jgi:hypothetical protein
MLTWVLIHFFLGKFLFGEVARLGQTIKIAAKACCLDRCILCSFALLAWLISHQPVILFSQNKPAIGTLLSEQTSTSHQPPANRTGSLIAQLTRSCMLLKYLQLNASIISGFSPPLKYTNALNSLIAAHLTAKQEGVALCS